MNRFEKHIREKLENREIRPAAGSWEKLEQELNRKKTKKRFAVRIAVAAAAAAAVAGTVFLQFDKTGSEVFLEETITPVVIHKPVENESGIQPAPEKEAEPVPAVSDVVVKTEKPAAETFFEKPDPEEVVKLELPAEENPVAATENTEEKEEAEILLAGARMKIQQQKKENPGTDAENLLAEVEEEVTRSFYDKVWYALGENFKKLTTAYAERNQ